MGRPPPRQKHSEGEKAVNDCDRQPVRLWRLAGFHGIAPEASKFTPSCLNSASHRKRDLNGIPYFNSTRMLDGPRIARILSSILEPHAVRCGASLELLRKIRKSKTQLRIKARELAMEQKMVALHRCPSDRDGDIWGHLPVGPGWGGQEVPSPTLLRISQQLSGSSSHLTSFSFHYSSRRSLGRFNLATFGSNFWPRFHCRSGPNFL